MTPATKQQNLMDEQQENKPLTLVEIIRPGWTVTIVNRFGQHLRGRAVMRSKYGGWVLNGGGRHGTPLLADNENIIKARP